MLPDALAPHAAPLLTLLLAFGWAALWRARGRPGWAALALPLAALAGFWWVLGSFGASARQLPERLPLLAVAASVLALPLAAFARTWLAVLLALLAGAFTAWWMAGAPLTEADLRRAAPVLVALGLLVPVLYRDLAGPWRGQAAALALAAALWAAAAPGPWAGFALILLAAALPLLVTGPAMPEAGRIGLAMLLAALLAGPILARGAPADWAAALAPLGLVLLGPRLAGRGAAWLAPLALLAAAAGPVALAWWLAG